MAAVHSRPIVGTAGGLTDAVPVHRENASADRPANFTRAEATIMATQTSVEAPTSVLSEEMLERFGQRAAVYDRENRFFQEDFEELREAGYLVAAVPTEFGGHGLSLAEVCREQRRLAYRAPATALAINMHLYWTGIAADLYRLGDASLT